MLQVALSVVLLVAASLTARSLRAIQRVDLGFDPAGVMTLDVLPPSDRFQKSEVNARFYARVFERLRAVPDVAGVAGLFLRPFEYGPIGSDVAVIVEGQPPRAPESWQAFPTLNSEAVSTDYFRVMGIALVRGRLFTDADRAGTTPVAIISQSAARRLWPGLDPLGRKLMASGDQPLEQWQTVVGVVADVRYRGVDDPRLDLYKPYLQSEALVKHVMIKMAGSASLRLDALRGEIRALEPDAAVDALRPMDEVIGREYAPWRFTAVLFSLLAALAMTLALMGLYATLSAQVAERTREIGIRIALGARRLQVVGLVVRRVVPTVVAGLALGLLAAAVTSHGLRSLLFGVTPADVVTYVFVCGVLLATAAGAACRPAHRAATVDPLVALKEE
jgi:putative ABC transport system permease protein